MAITVDNLKAQLAALVSQRDQTYDTWRRILGAIELLTVLIDQEQKEEQPVTDVNPALPFPEVGADSTIHTEADVPQEG